MKIILAILVALTGIVSSSSEVEEVKGPQPCSEKRSTDASNHFDEMLKCHVGVDGRVDYVGIRQNPFQLIAFVRFLEAISSESIQICSRHRATQKPTGLMLTTR